MKKKYKKDNAVTKVNLHDRKNIKIINAEKEPVTDDEIELFKEQLQVRYKIADDFCNYFIEKQLESGIQLSEKDFDMAMKEMIQQHKILKSLLKE